MTQTYKMLSANLLVWRRLPIRYEWQQEGKEKKILLKNFANFQQENIIWYALYAEMSMRLQMHVQWPRTVRLCVNIHSCNACTYTLLTIHIIIKSFYYISANLLPIYNISLWCLKLIVSILWCHTLCKYGTHHIHTHTHTLSQVGCKALRMTKILSLNVTKWVLFFNIVPLVVHALLPAVLQGLDTIGQKS